MNVPKIENMIGRNNEPVKNQFVIMTAEGSYFQSYKSIIAFKPYKGKIKLDSTYRDYHVTTGKYRNLFLGETKKETQAKIDSVEYELVSLNND